MSITNFIIVLIFNVYWVVDGGCETYLYAYNIKENGWLSVVIWAFALWGLANLLYVLIEL